jgi:hypothetical protein
MKTQVKILIALLIIVPGMASENTDADAKINNGLKKQCQYVVYGNGNDSSLYAGVMAGIPEDIRSSLAVKDTTAFSKYTTQSTMQLKACKNALKHITSDGFKNDYKKAVLKLTSAKYRF